MYMIVLAKIALNDNSIKMHQIFDKGQKLVILEKSIE